MCNKTCKDKPPWKEARHLSWEDNLARCLSTRLSVERTPVYLGQFGQVPKVSPLRRCYWIGIHHANACNNVSTKGTYNWIQLYINTTSLQCMIGLESFFLGNYSNEILQWEVYVGFSLYSECSFTLNLYKACCLHERCIAGTNQGKTKQERTRIKDGCY
jgi:hypothetical protein